MVWNYKILKNLHLFALLGQRSSIQTTIQQNLPIRSSKEF